MIVVFSTSSPLASVALLDSRAGVLAAAAREAPRQAGGACLGMLEALLAEMGLRLDDATLFVADVGPGSFTGVKVGVTLAKTLAFARGVPVAGVTSFDLIDPSRATAVPCKRGETWVRLPGTAPRRVPGNAPSGTLGYGPGCEPEVWPEARRADAVRDLWDGGPAETFVPSYGMEPSISLPKRPYGARGH